MAQKASERPPGGCKGCKCPRGAGPRKRLVAMDVIVAGGGGRRPQISVWQGVEARLRTAFQEQLRVDKNRKLVFTIEMHVEALEDEK